MLIIRIFTGIVLVVGLLQSGCQQIPAGTVHPHATLDRSVMVGYQGWFRTPNDGAGMGWTHYQKSPTNSFSFEKMAIDFWPDLSELSESEKTRTDLRRPDGSPIQLFSSHNARTVDRHFQWMHDYGISGAFVQRFTGPITNSDPKSRARLRATDTVLRFAQAGAEQHGRSIAIMYDLSGMKK
ncbi:MAG TPA: hypothetical protein VKC60_07700, partial [Opitutaceae bacterium]|nr:hypothetical protein [Opitutaceae bacterium]